MRHALYRSVAGGRTHISQLRFAQFWSFRRGVTSKPPADAFCTPRSVLSTWRKQGRSGVAALEASFAGRSPEPSATVLNSDGLREYNGKHAEFPGAV